MSKNNNKSTILFFGAIIGFILGILFAPQKGEETRKEAKEKFDQIKEDPQGTIKDVARNLQEKVSSAIQSVEDSNIEIMEEDIVISQSFSEEK